MELRFRMLLRSRTAVAAVALLAGCNDASLSPSSPRIEVAPGQIVFGAIAAGESETKTATVTNRGGSVLVVDRIELGGAQPDAFAFQAAVADAFPVTLAPGDWFAVQVTFAPDSEDAHAGVMTVFSNDASAPSVAVPLVTAALLPDIDAQPSPLAFGTVTTGVSSVQPITVTNVGGADLYVQSAAMAAGSDAAFAVDGSALPATLAPGASLVLPVTYAPTAAAAAAGSVEIGSDDPDEATAVVPLSGNATTNPVPDIHASPAAISFGQVQRLTCSTKTTSIQNHGAATLNVNNVTRGFVTSAEYTFSPTAFTVAPGAAQVLAVTYCPTDTGVDPGTLQVFSDDPDENPFVLNLYGEGVPPPVAQTDIAIEVTWDRNDTDIDTHFIRPGGSFNGSPGDCYYLNLSPDWGMSGDPTDDPYLDYDDVDGYGPESLNFAGPVTGTYRLVVHYYSDHGNGPTNVTVKVWLNGTLAWTSAPKNVAHHQRWDVVDIAWDASTDSGSVVTVDTVTQMFAFGPSSK